MNAARPPQRIPPHNLQAEESLLGAMLLSRHALITGLDRCHTTDFYSGANSLIYDAIATLTDDGVPADPVTVAAELDRIRQLEHIGGHGRLLALQASCPAASNAAHYAELVANAATLRRLIAFAAETTEAAYGRPADVQGLVDATAGDLVTLATTTAGNDPLKIGLAHDVAAVLEELDGGVIPGHPTGWIDVDAFLLNLRPSTLTLIGARPSVGKSVFLGQLALHLATRGIRVLFVSAEMSRLELTRRWLANLGHIDLESIQTAAVAPRDQDRLGDAMVQLAGLPIDVEDASAPTFSFIRRRTTEITRLNGGTPPVVLIDYLQICRPDKPSGDRRVDVDGLAEAAKALAKDFDAIVVAAAQLHRGVEGRLVKVPVLSDFRESGQLEQAADVALALHRNDLHLADGDTPDHLMTVVGLKNRHGRLGHTDLFADLAHARIANLSRRTAA